MEKIRKYFFVVRELTMREVKRKYARSSLGIVWSVLNPLLHMVVMSLVFSTLFRRSIANYPIYYLTGQLIWSLFSNSTMLSMSAMVDNKNLLVRTKNPKQVFIISRIYTSLVNFGYSCIAYILMLIIFKMKPSWTWLLFVVDVLLTILFSMGIGYMLSTAYVFFSDISYLYSVFMSLLIFLSGLFYPLKSLPDFMQTAVGASPIYELLYFARTCIMDNKVPEIEVWISLLTWSFGSFLTGLAVFKWKENDVMAKI